jgi:adenylate cyclase
VKNLRLRPIILILFALLTMPVVVAIVTINYFANERTARANAEALVARFRDGALQNVHNTFEPIKTLVQGAAEVGQSQPDFYSDNRSDAFLFTILQHSPQIVAAYIGAEDGSFRQARRMGNGNDGTPPGARYAWRWIGSTTSDGKRLDHYDYRGEAGQDLGQSARPTDYDPRIRPWYRQTAAAGKLHITDPELFAVLDLIGLTVAAPYFDQGRLLGVAAVDLTLDDLSTYLANSRISPGTQSYILDRGGRVIANSEQARTYSTVNGQVELQHVTSLSDELPAVAFSARPRDNIEQLYSFRHNGQEYLATLSTLDPAFGKNWQLFIITPVHDFAGRSDENNVQLLIFGLAAILLQILIIYYLSGVISKPLEKLATKVIGIQQRNSADTAGTVRSSISEVSVLSRAIDTLDTTVRSFAAFVPWALVRQLLASDQKLELGGHSRFLTIFFSDLESFSTLSEKVPSRELLLRVSAYLEVVTRAVNQESGTIDKFIGDGVMAFWGAPNLLEDHAWHACVAALRVQLGMRELNRQWAAENKQHLNVRIGIHSDAVLVGNIGSQERMSYTVIGDGVNVAARLEGVNKEYGTLVCISHNVFKEAGERLLVRPIDEVTVKGRRTAVPIYELMGAYGAGAELEPDERTVRLAELSTLAHAALISGDRAAAKRHYEAILADFPDDPIATRMIAKVPAKSEIRPVSS